MKRVNKNNSIFILIDRNDDSDDDDNDDDEDDNHQWPSQMCGGGLSCLVSDADFRLNTPGICPG